MIGEDPFIDGEQKTMKPLLRVVFSFLVWLPYTAHSMFIVSTVDYGNVSVRSIETTFSESQTVLQAQPWWGNAGFAASVAEQVKFQLGSSGGPDGSPTFGPLVAYGISEPTETPQDGNSIPSLSGLAGLVAVGAQNLYIDDEPRVIAALWSSGSLATPTDPGTSCSSLSGLAGLVCLGAQNLYLDSDAPSTDSSGGGLVSLVPYGTQDLYLVAASAQVPAPATLLLLGVGLSALLYSRRRNDPQQSRE